MSGNKLTGIREKLRQTLEDKLERYYAWRAITRGEDILSAKEYNWEGIPYVSEHVRWWRASEEAYDHYYKINITGIRVPMDKRLKVNNIRKRDIFYPLVRHVGVGIDKAEPCSMSDVFRKRIPFLGMELGGYFIPGLNGDENTEVEREAKRIIEGYIKYRPGIENAFSEVQRFVEVNPKAFLVEDCTGLRRILIDKCGLDFIRPDGMYFKNR